MCGPSSDLQTNSLSHLTSSMVRFHDSHIIVQENAAPSECVHDSGIWGDVHDILGSVMHWRTELNCSLGSTGGPLELKISDQASHFSEAAEMEVRRAHSRKGHGEAAKSWDFRDVMPSARCSRLPSNHLERPGRPLQD